MTLLSIQLSRREFLVVTGVAGAGAAALLIVGCDDDGAPLAIALVYPKLRIGRLDEMTAGQPLDFDYPAAGQRNFAVKLGERARGGVGPDQDIVGFSYLCTHMGCPLVGQYKDEHKVIGPCPCHFSTFDLRNNGMVVLGQATENLPQILLTVEGEELFATGIAGLIYGAGNNLREAQAVEAAS